MYQGISSAGRRALLLPVGAIAVNQAVYYGGDMIARDKPHLCLELPIDNAVPFLPWAVSIYLGCFLFWAVMYLYMARQEEARAYRFFLADLLAKLMCFAFFVLLPTTNVRPSLGSDGLWEKLVALVYRVDQPTNLFPSIHCMVSWLCFIGVRGERSLPHPVRAIVCAIAIAVCWSTLAVRQHVIVDVIGGVLAAETGWWFAGRDFRFFASNRHAEA